MVRKSFRWLGHLIPQVLGQNQFHGAYIKQDKVNARFKYLEKQE